MKLYKLNPIYWLGYLFCLVRPLSPSKVFRVKMYGYRGFHSWERDYLAKRINK